MGSCSASARYEEALEILRPYEGRNTALAYMSLGYDAAAYRILRAEPEAGSTGRPAVHACDSGGPSG